MLRTLAFVVVMAAMLTACGSGSTLDPYEFVDPENLEDRQGYEPWSEEFSTAPAGEAQE